MRRLIDFDRSGSGASDRVPLNAIPTWEEMAEDLTAVLDEVGSGRTALMGILETGPIALLFAAMHPERVSELILMHTTARYMPADDYAIAISPDAIDFLVRVLEASWGTEDMSTSAASCRLFRHQRSFSTPPICR